MKKRTKDGTFTPLGMKCFHNKYKRSVRKTLVYYAGARHEWTSFPFSTSAEAEDLFCFAVRVPRSMRRRKVAK